MKNFRWFPTVVFVFCLANISFSQGIDVEISGRVVGSDGLPNSNVLVSMITPTCEECLDWTIPFSDTTDNGEFFLNAPIPAHTKFVRVYAIEKLPIGLLDPTDPADLVLRKIPGFRGLKVKVPESGKIRLGDIQPTFRYMRLEIDLTKVFEKRVLQGVRYSPLSWSIFYGDTEIVLDEAVDSKFISSDGRFLRLALPEGRWRLDIVTNDKSKCGRVMVAAKGELVSGLCFQTNKVLRTHSLSNEKGLLLIEEAQKKLSLFKAFEWKHMYLSK